MRLFKKVGWLLLDKSRWLGSPNETYLTIALVLKTFVLKRYFLLPQMRFPVLVNWHCASSQANQPKIQKLEETWCVKIT